MPFSYHVKRSDLTLQNISFGLMRVYKLLYQRAIPRRHSGPKTLVIIHGCQRSGTSMLYWIFEHDLRAKIYREASKLSSDDATERIRLNPLPAVQETVAKDRQPFIVIKPLVESQRAAELLNYFPDSKIIWLYRHYEDVASSNLKAFSRQQGIEDLRPIVLRQPHNWRSENVSEETRQTIRHFFAEEMNPYDAAALFWYARNRLFFEQGLAHQPRVRLCRYEELVRAPVGVMRHLYAFIGLSYPGDHIVKAVHSHAVEKERRFQLSAAVELLCAEMLEQLDTCCAQARPGAISRNRMAPLAAPQIEEGLNRDDND
jgi:hypothetical protein